MFLVDLDSGIIFFIESRCKVALKSNAATVVNP